jgi:hypothetical protein
MHEPMENEGVSTSSLYRFNDCNTAAFYRSFLSEEPRLARRGVCLEGCSDKEPW